MGLAALKRIQVGKEGSLGSLAAATSRLMGLSLGHSLADSVISQPDDQRGNLAGAFRSYTKSQMWEDTLSGEATFEDILYFLSMALKTAPSPSTVDTSARKWLYTPALTSSNTPDTYTFEIGDDTQEYQVLGCFLKDLQISAAFNEAWKVSAGVVGQKLTASTFTGALADRTVESALAQKTKLFMDDSGGTIGTTQKTVTLLDWTWKLPAHFEPAYYQDGNLFYQAVKEAKMLPTLELTGEFNSGVATLRTKYTGETRQLVRLISTGSLCGGVTAVRTLNIDGAYKITKFDKLDEKQGADIVKMTLSAEYDATYAKLFEIYTQNAVTAVP